MLTEIFVDILQNEIFRQADTVPCAERIFFTIHCIYGYHILLYWKKNVKNLKTLTNVENSRVRLLSSYTFFIPSSCV